MARRPRPVPAAVIATAAPPTMAQTRGLFRALLVSAAAAAAHAGTTWTTSPSPFEIIIDGGSTGSRLHVFEFDGASCVRRGSARADRPLTAFAATEVVNATAVAQHLLPLLDYAATVVPARHRPATRVRYQATAGMRLLTEDKQRDVLDAMYRGLRRTDQPFQVRRGDLATLGGDLEGFYGAVAANYLHGVIDAEMKVLMGKQEQVEGQSKIHEDDDDDDDEDAVGSNTCIQPMGALDMGGASAQIVYKAPAGEALSDLAVAAAQNACAMTDDGYDQILNGNDFYSASYLAYGVDQFRERLWNELISYNDAMSKADQEDGACVNPMVDVSNPCANKGYRQEFKGRTLIGTGDTEDCIRHVRRLIPHADDVRDDHDHVSDRRVGGVVHPPLQPGVKFVAMSLYFFTLDSLRVFSKNETLHETWPTPSLDELHHALDGLCTRSWGGDLENDVNEHAFTRPDVLPHRCLESVYLVTLLRDGFGFDPLARDITFLFTVDGDEVEWTMGMAIATRSRYGEEEEDEDEEGAIDVRDDDEEDAAGTSEEDDANTTCQNQACNDNPRQRPITSNSFFSEWIWRPYNQ